MNWILLSSIASISLLGAMSPGPDFAIVVKNTLQGSIKDGIKTSFGIASALLVHLSYTIFGIAALVKETPALYRIIQYSGAAYLLYLGVMLFKSHKAKAPIEGNIKKSTHSPFISGFLTNLLNPKAMLFILAMFTQVISTQQSLMLSLVCMGIVISTGLGWFIFLSTALSSPKFKSHLNKHQRKVNIAMGVLLCGLSLKIVLS